MPPRIVDLSHRLKPGVQRFRLEVRTRSVEEYVPEYKVPPGEWYVMADVEICSHVGTHVEAPLHAFEKGADAAQLDIRSLIGPAAVVDFSDKRAGEAIGLAEMADRGAHLERGDILLVRTGLSRHYLTKRYKRPYIDPRAVDWIVERGIKAFGIDCSGFEQRTGGLHEVNHRKLLGRSIPIMEDLNNLDRLSEPRVFFVALPLPIEGLDASWIRPLAVEPLEAGRRLAEVFLAPDAQWER
jgi:arylformamidase